MTTLLLLIGILSFAIYFIPTIVGRKHRNAASIFILNLLLGWTLIGWVIAMVWAVSDDKKETIIINNKTSVPEQLKQLKELYDNGTLTEDEFETEKKRLLGR